MRVWPSLVVLLAACQDAPKFEPAPGRVVPGEPFMIKAGHSVPDLPGEGQAADRRRDRARDDGADGGHDLTLPRCRADAAEARPNARPAASAARAL